MLIFVSILALGIADRIQSLVNQEVSTVYTLQDATIDMKRTMTIRNIGTDSVDSFFVSFDKAFADRLGYLTASEGKKQLMLVNPSEATGTVGWKVKFAETLGPSASTTVTLNGIVGHAYKPFPEETLLLEGNLALISLPLRILSFYETEVESTIVSGTKGVIAHAPPELRASSVNEMVWKSEKTSPAFSTGILKLHLTHSAGVANFESVNRRVEISHWGGVQFFDNFALKNNAAKLEEEFSRIPFSIAKNMKGGTHPVEGLIKDVRAVLPRYARDVEYFDVIGNVTSSHAARVGKTHILLELEPRFPLLGGWGSEYSISFGLPARHVLTEGDDNTYRLSIPLNHPSAHIFSDKVNFEILLPEGAMNVVVETAGDGGLVRGLSPVVVGKAKSWLDTPFFGGHTQVTFSILGGFAIPEKEALNHKFFVSYTLPKIAVFRQPALLVFYFFSLFVLYIAFSRAVGLSAGGDTPGLWSVTNSGITSGAASGAASGATSGVASGAVSAATSEPTTPSEAMVKVVTEKRDSKPTVRKRK